MLSKVEKKQTKTKNKSKILISLILSICFIWLFGFIVNADTQHYTITYKKDMLSMASFTPTDVSLTSHYDEFLEEEIFELTEEIPTIEGYNFIGWNIDGTDETYLGGRKIKATGDLVVIGQYTIGECKVRYINAYSEVVEEKVVTGRDYRVREPGFWYGREFVRYDMYDYDDTFIKQVKDREVIEINKNVKLKAVWNDYDNIFVSKIYFIELDGAAAYAKSLDNNAPLLLCDDAIIAGKMYSYTKCEYTNKSENAITDIRLFEGSIYNASEVNFDGKIYTIAKKEGESVPYNIRSMSGYGGEPLFLGYTSDSSDNEKIMGRTIMSKSYRDASIVSIWDGKAFHNRVKDQNGNPKNILDGTTGIGGSVRENYITYDKYDITTFIDDSQVYAPDINSSEWMKKIPDNYFVTEINTPATHDSGSKHAYRGDPLSRGFTETQSLNIYEQLEAGVRQLDIRTRYDDGMVKVVHNNYDMEYDDQDKSIDSRLHRPARTNTEYLMFEDAMYWSVKFVTEHPSETVLMAIQAEKPYGEALRDGTRKIIEKYMYGYDGNVKCDAEPGRIWIENRIPTMREARGKVIILNNWWYSKNDYKNIGYGIDNTKDGDMPRSSDYYEFATEGGQEDTRYNIDKYISKYFTAVESSGYVVFVDRPAQTISKKYIWELANSTEKKRVIYFLNTQVRNGGAHFPRNYFQEMHTYIINHGFISGIYYGTIAFDYVSPQIAKELFVSNFSYFWWH